MPRSGSIVSNRWRVPLRRYLAYRRAADRRIDAVEAEICRCPSTAEEHPSSLRCPHQS